MIGVRADGRKELVALVDGYRKSGPGCRRISWKCRAEYG